MIDATESARRCIELAKKHVNPQAIDTSARICLRDAENCLRNNMPGSAVMWARKSLCYSVGVFHADYQAVNAVYQGA